MNFTFNQEIRFIGGRYKGYNGVVKLQGDSTAEVTIKVNGEPFSVIEETKFMQDKKEWASGKSALELAMLPS